MEKEIKIKVGDKVLLKNERGENWNSDGDMDKYKGKVVTVSGFIPFNSDSFYIKEDEDDEDAKSTFTGRWIFDIDDIEKVITDDFTLDNLQFADIVTTRNGERYVVAEGRIYGEGSDYKLDCDDLSDVYDEHLICINSWGSNNSYFDIMKVERAGQVIWERSEEVKEVKEMTIAEISEALGYEVKVVKETEK